MRTKKHYEEILNKNPDASIGFSLAADMVFAAKNGAFVDHDNEWKTIARELKSKYGENLTVDEVRAEMASVLEPTAELIVRKIPVSLRAAFKSRCAADMVSQQDKIIELMNGYVNS